MKFSHSKLSTILKCPATYNLIYNIGLSLKFKKPALTIGSAVHWGIEHNTENISEYDEEELNEETISLCQAMIHGYLFHKEKIFNNLLRDEDGSKLELYEEIHELDISSNLKSFKYQEPHLFNGIIDLLLITNKGFILVDYKTSSTEPKWDTYLDQLYRYIYLLNTNFSDIPVYKIAIINLKKSRTRKLPKESYDNYQRRLEIEYEINENDLVNYHEYKITEINDNLMNSYIKNLSRMCDTAQLIADNKAWYINFNAINDYGGSDFKDIFLRTPSSYILYNIKDKVYDEETNNIVNKRDCIELDIYSIEEENVLNKYTLFKEELDSFIKSNKTPLQLLDKTELFIHLKSKYICDDDLLEKYWITYIFENKN